MIAAAGQPAAADSLICVDAVAKTFRAHDGGRDAGVHDASLVVSPGEFVFVVGQTGSGKTTLLRMLERRVRPDRGRICVGGTDLHSRRFNGRDWARRIGVVNQDLDPVEEATVAENIAMRLQFRHMDPALIGPRVRELLRVFGLEHRADLVCQEGRLSGGEKQRLCIARAIAHGPALLICDEPTGHLDRANSARIMRLLNRISMLGTTVVCATHHDEMVDLMRKRVVCVHRGEIILDVPQGDMATVRAAQRAADRAGAEPAAEDRDGSPGESAGPDLDADTDGGAP